jgi:DUF1009 family protein
MSGALGMIAGAGDLPVDLAERCAAEAAPYFIVRLKGLHDGRLDAHPGVTLPLGRLGAAIDAFRSAGCDRLLFSGKVMRPTGLGGLSLDWRGLKGIVSLLLGNWSKDDRLHRQISRLFERDGLRVVGPAEVWPDLLAKEGVLTLRQPSPADWDAIRLATAAAYDLALTDKGQGAVVRAGQVIALEGRGHTDGLLRDVQALTGQGGVLVKIAKPHQDRRIDLPVVGPGTILAAIAARLDGIAVETGSAMIIRPTETAAAADRAGLFLVGFDPRAVTA